jgi:hypothetical protein
MKRFGWMTTALMATTLVNGTAWAGSVAVMSYNVRGLPAAVIENRTTQMAAIAPLLEDFHTPATPYVGIDSIVLLQELFDQGYYNTLTNPATVTYPSKTAKDSSGPSFIGDGLNMLSDFTFTGFDRTQWNNCFGTGAANGSDCDTNKGYSFARFTLEAGVTVDVYNLHADAGQDEGSRTARRANITQLATRINATSPAGTAVIVMGDTNSKYTRTPNDNIGTLLSSTGVTDVWVQLRKGGVVPPAGADIDSSCSTDPSTGNCELVDKVFYRSGDNVTLTPTSYEALDDMFSDGVGNDLSDHFPVAVTFDFTVPFTSTTSSTSTSTSTSTTTTTIPSRPCGDPLALIAGPMLGAGEGESAVYVVAASDALLTLKAAVGSAVCALCVCDVDSNGSVGAADALRVLKKAVGQDIALTCVPCT